MQALVVSRIITRNVAWFQTDGKLMVVDRSGKQFRLQEVWWLHSCLTNATEMINSVYALQLLLWISSMSFNTLTRIYTINDNAVTHPLLMVREILLVSACVTNLLIITIICHVTANQVSLIYSRAGSLVPCWRLTNLFLFSLFFQKANRVGKVAFTPSSAILAKRNFTQVKILPI